MLSNKIPGKAHTTTHIKEAREKRSEMEREKERQKIKRRIKMQNYTWGKREKK